MPPTKGGGVVKNKKPAKVKPSPGMKDFLKKKQKADAQKLKTLQYIDKEDASKDEDIVKSSDGLYRKQLDVEARKQKKENAAQQKTRTPLFLSQEIIEAVAPQKIEQILDVSMFKTSPAENAPVAGRLRELQPYELDILLTMCQLIPRRAHIIGQMLETIMKKRLRMEAANTAGLVFGSIVQPSDLQTALSYVRNLAEIIKVEKEEEERRKAVAGKSKKKDDALLPFKERVNDEIRQESEKFASMQGMLAWLEVVAEEL